MMESSILSLPKWGYPNQGANFSVSEMDSVTYIHLGLNSYCDSWLYET